MLSWAVFTLGVLACGERGFSAADSTDQRTTYVRSKDGTLIAVECVGQGPELLIVHGGSGDHRRWRPIMSLLATRFTVCAMDRRGHGESEPGSAYALKKEFDDVVTVVNSRPGPVAVLGHSFGAVCALEAAFRSRKITRLVLYEPPLQDLDHTAVADRMERMIRAGQREEALQVFMREVVRMSEDEIARMRTQPGWPDRVAGIDVQIREMRALSKYRFDPARARTLRIPTLLLKGGRSASPQLAQAIQTLEATLPNRTLIVFEHQEHNAMDLVPQAFADSVARFLAGPR